MLGTPGQDVLGEDRADAGERLELIGRAVFRSTGAPALASGSAVAAAPPGSAPLPAPAIAPPGAAGAWEPDRHILAVHQLRREV